MMSNITRTTSYIRELEGRVRALQAVVDKLPKNPRVCLCGSTRFMEAFFAAGWKLTLMDYIVLSVGVCKHTDAEGGHGGEMLGGATAERLDKLHLRKIDLSDWVLVLNVEGYYGQSTSREIEYAKSIGRPVRFLFSNELFPRRETPPKLYDYEGCWDLVTAATEEAAKGADGAMKDGE